MNEVSKTIRQQIDTAELTPDTRGILKVMAMFNEANTAFFEWTSAFYGVGDENNTEFSEEYEQLYYFLEKNLCRSIYENMNKLPFKGI